MKSKVNKTLVEAARIFGLHKAHYPSLSDVRTIDERLIFPSRKKSIIDETILKSDLKHKLKDFF